MNDIRDIQNKIDEMEYWDARVLDFQCQYFGDNVEIILEDDDEHVYKLTLQQCSEVTYSNHYTTESDIAVENMNVKQLGYFAQDITVTNSDKADLYKISLDLPMLFCTVTCKNIIIDRVKKNSISFFWENN